MAELRSPAAAYVELYICFHSPWSCVYKEESGARAHHHVVKDLGISIMGRGLSPPGRAGGGQVNKHVCMNAHTPVCGHPPQHT